MVRALKEKVSAEGGEESDEAATLGRLLFDAAVLESGFQVDDPKVR